MHLLFSITLACANYLLTSQLLLFIIKTIKTHLILGAMLCYHCYVIAAHTTTAFEETFI
jgi:hypothetical protein